MPWRTIIDNIVLPLEMKGEDKNCELLMEYSIKLDDKGAYLTDCRKHLESSCPVEINKCPTHKIEFLGLKLLPYNDGVSKIILVDSNNKKVKTSVNWDLA